MYPLSHGYPPLHSYCSTDLLDSPHSALRSCRSNDILFSYPRLSFLPHRPSDSCNVCVPLVIVPPPLLLCRFALLLHITVCNDDSHTPDSPSLLPIYLLLQTTPLPCDMVIWFTICLCSYVLLSFPRMIPLCLPSFLSCPVP